MPRSLRAVTFLICALLWLSGAGWMLLHFFLEKAGEFGATPHPLEPTFMRVHGAIAVTAVFLLGWVSARHITAIWRSAQRRWSGLTLTIVSAILIVTGYALYYVSDDALRRVVGATHETIGVLVIATALIHWWWRRERASHSNHGLPSAVK